MSRQSDPFIMRRPDTSRQIDAPQQGRRPERRLRLVLTGLSCAAILIGGCATQQITKRGAQVRDTDVAQIQPGMGQEQVKLALGTPSTTSTTGDGSAYYYISSTETQTSFFKPNEVDRKVLAIYFTPTALVERVANYGLKDGKVFDFSSRTTPVPGSKEDGILKSLFRNLGQKQIFGDN
ncbi:MAG: outer membrane protein assembly factor BamE [Hyphomicrobium sp.]